MKAGFEKKEKTIPPPLAPVPEAIEFNLKDLEAGKKDIENSKRDPEMSGPGQAKPAAATEQFQKILVTTSFAIEGRKVGRYGGVVSCQAVVKLDGLEKYLADVKDVSSLRSTPYGNLFKKAETLLMSDLKIEAAKKEADAVIGISIDYEFAWKNAVMVCASGTVVYLEDVK
jgi:uncharacterized protein YbjQ (UPF0145 family)